MRCSDDLKTNASGQEVFTWDPQSFEFRGRQGPSRQGDYSIFMLEVESCGILPKLYPTLPLSQRKYDVS